MRHMRQCCKMKSNKSIRFLQAFNGVEEGRKGKCAPDKCETVDGRKGSACCKLGYVCPCLRKDNACGIYLIRPVNCKVFPRTREDLKLVNNCGYYWEEK